MWTKEENDEKTTESNKTTKMHSDVVKARIKIIVGGARKMFNS